MPDRETVLAEWEQGVDRCFIDGDAAIVKDWASAKVASRPFEEEPFKEEPFGLEIQRIISGADLLNPAHPERCTIYGETSLHFLEYRDVDRPRAVMGVVARAAAFYALFRTFAAGYLESLADLAPDCDPRVDSFWRPFLVYPSAADAAAAAAAITTTTTTTTTTTAATDGNDAASGAAADDAANADAEAVVHDDVPAADADAEAEAASASPATIQLEEYPAHALQAFWQQESTPAIINDHSLSHQLKQQLEEQKRMLAVLESRIRKLEQEITERQAELDALQTLLSFEHDA